MGNGFWAETTNTCTGRSGGMVKTNQRSMCQSGTHPWNAQPHLSWTCHIPSIATEVLKKHHGFSMGGIATETTLFPKSLEDLKKRRNTLWWNLEDCQIFHIQWQQQYVKRQGERQQYVILFDPFCTSSAWKIQVSEDSHGGKEHEPMGFSACLSTLSTPLFWQTFPPGRVFFAQMWHVK